MKRANIKWSKPILLFTIFFLFLLPLGIAFANEDLYPFTSQQSAQRFALLTHEIRCVVCQNQNLAESNAPLANDLRNKIYQMVLQQKSNSEIKSYLVARYGNFVLFKPPLNGVTVALWAFPTVGLIFIFLLLFRTISRKASHKP